MRSRSHIVRVLAALALASAPARAWDSGGTGELGALEPVTDVDITLPDDGVLDYTSIHVPVDVKVTFRSNAANTPVVIRVTGDVVVEGLIDLSGRAPATAPVGSGWSSIGGAGGPGGTFGGSATGLVGLAGHGPAGAPGTSLCNAGGGGSLAYRGFPGGSCACGGVAGAAHLSRNVVVRLAGGGGGASWTSGGGGGGGGITIAADGSITIDGVVLARGGASVGGGGAGGGGTITLVAEHVDGDGVLDATSGACGGCAQGGCGAPGVIVIAATTRGGSLFDNAAPLPALALPEPPLPVDDLVVPTLTITKVGGVSAPAQDPAEHPALATPITASAGRDVTVELEGRFVTPGLYANVIVDAPDRSRARYPTTRLTGTLELTTATATVKLPGVPGEAMIHAELPSVPYGFTAGCDPASPTPQTFRARCCADPGCTLALTMCVELTGSAYAGAAATTTCQTLLGFPYASTVARCSGGAVGKCILSCGEATELEVFTYTGTVDDARAQCVAGQGVWAGQ
ncbi:MAG: hypothetical protein IT385_27310 [Deltaproteobacteria bacterium]|nr:hypothetical protein [Deltaproteobacteria bacterium]